MMPGGEQEVFKKMARASREHRAWCQDALVPVSRVLAEHERYHSREVPAFSLEGMLVLFFFKRFGEKNVLSGWTGCKEWCFGLETFADNERRALFSFF